MKLVLVTPVKHWKDIFEEVLQMHNKEYEKEYKDESFVLETIFRQDYLNFEGITIDGDVVMARGMAAFALRRQLDIPVIQIPQGIFCIENAAEKAMELYNPKKIAVVGFNFSMLDVDIISHVSRAMLHVYVLPDSEKDGIQEKIERKILEAKDDGCDAFLCGYYGNKYCQENHLNSVFIDISKQETWLALTDAKHNAYVHKNQRLKAEMYKSVLDYSSEGVLSLDRNMNVQVCNNAAERILAPGGIKADDVQNQIKSELEQAGILKLAADAQEHNDEIILYKNRNFTVNTVPIQFKNEYHGSVVLIQDTTRIQKLENRIRHEIYSKGHVAKYTFSDIKGQSRAIENVRQIAKDYAAAESNVLIYGETGTGKEMFAQSIHNHSRRKNGPFVAINCAALAESILESELFGYVEGAFTGAIKGGKPGLFELAHNGTIFLDEISEIPLRLQSKLLRVIHEREIMRLGDDRVTHVDVRILCATNKVLSDLVFQGRFKEDLYYRIDVLRIDVPPLSQRIDDIPLLARHFFSEEAVKNKKKIMVEESTYNELKRIDYKGNIRQLHNICERMVVVCKTGIITGSDVLKVYAQEGSSQDREVLSKDGTEYEKKKASALMALNDIERSRIKNALEENNGNKEAAAKTLHISRATFYRRMREYSL